MADEQRNEVQNASLWRMGWRVGASVCGLFLAAAMLFMARG